MMRSSRPDPPKNPAGSVLRHVTGAEGDVDTAPLPEDVYKRTNRRTSAGVGASGGGGGGGGGGGTGASGGGYSGGSASAASKSEVTTREGSTTSVRSVATLLHAAHTVSSRWGVRTCRWSDGGREGGWREREGITCACRSWCRRSSVYVAVCLREGSGCFSSNFVLKHKALLRVHVGLVWFLAVANTSSAVCDPFFTPPPPPPPPRLAVEGAAVESKSSVDTGDGFSPA
jgi:hypothetical protein